MAILLETLVLRGNRVVDGVVTGMVRSGSNGADRQTPELLSHPRCLSQLSMLTGYASATWGAFIDARDEDPTRLRAGRLGSSVGVLVSRSLASPAGRAVLWGWSFAVGGPVVTAAGCFGSLRTKAPATGTKGLQERQPSAFTLGERTGNRRMRPGKGGATWPASVSMPAGGTFAASTRGK
jgi:hypothetical protein